MDILVAPHIPADIGMAAAIVKGLYAEAGPEASYRPFRLGGTPHPTHSSEFFAAYKNAELVVGMRGHSVICGVGLRKPTIAISTHPKVIGFMDACGLEKWTVQLSDQMAGNLVELSDGILENVGRDYLAQRDSHVGDFEHRFEAFLELAMRRVSSEK